MRHEGGPQEGKKAFKSGRYVVGVLTWKMKMGWDGCWMGSASKTGSHGFQGRLASQQWNVHVGTENNDLEGMCRLWQ